ncbi:hypothetical protein CC78DRAFT_580293 [Lojkania enalia]|uniref:Uncharacterized protein n=1 Tax=Lojkania enalia TaxID=147567 RepID=A0A9P4K9C6_9PLEO|nr:hypothetical protein CC78DRAFT_580293 [Didymosphaeria enalia]
MSPGGELLNEDDQQAEIQPERGNLTIDNQYFALNPWYNRRPEHPIFDLAKPLPRPVSLEDKDPANAETNDSTIENRTNTTRRLKEESRGRGVNSMLPILDEDLYPNHHAEEQEDGQDFQVLLNEDHPLAPLVYFETVVNVQRIGVRRLNTNEAGRVLQDRGIYEHGFRYKRYRTRSEGGTFGLQDGLPLQEPNTKTSNRHDIGMNVLILGPVVYLLEITPSYNTEPSMSPAWDFSSRLVTLFAGYGTQTFISGWWKNGPCSGCTLRSMVGCILYDPLVFTGAKSPINYRWPGPGEIWWRTENGANEAERKIEQRLEEV